MLDFQERMAIGKAQHKREIERSGGNPYPCRAHQGDRYRNMNHDDRADLETDWHAWHAEQDEMNVTEEVDASQDQTEERKVPPPAKPIVHPARSGVQHMTAAQYKAACKKLDISIYASAKVLGISLSSAQRYAGGQWPVPETVAKLLRALVKLGLTEI